MQKLGDLQMNINESIENSAIFFENLRLKEQIEKMKCCSNCGMRGKIYTQKEMDFCISCSEEYAKTGKSDKWFLGTGHNTFMGKR